MTLWRFVYDCFFVKVFIKKFKAGFKHAFALESDPISDRAFKDFESIALTVKNKKMEIPVVMMLEMLRPLNFITSQVMYAVSPLALLFGKHRQWNSVAESLENRNAISSLIECIEKDDRMEVQKNSDRADNFNGALR